MKKPREISIKVTRNIHNGHLTYTLDGNFSPLPCGNLVESRVREFFRKITKPANESEGNFFRIIERETHGTLHVSIFNQLYPARKDRSNTESTSRDIKFIDLRPTSVLYNNLTSDEGGGLAEMQKEYRELWGILNSVEDGEDTILVELTPPSARS
ncbi:hypothetical protein HOF92_16310 [bacterium]|jgi:hypothetical protein|nr:hypothetical protein [bacterium]